MKVILDYDDVLNECNEEAIRKLNKEYGYSYCLEDITNWGILENELDKRIPYFVQPKFVRNIPIREGARKLVCELLKRHCEIFIATSVPSQCAGVRIADIIRNFPEIDPGNILIGSRKDILVADILLDDCYFNIEHSNVRYPVLFRKPWNAQYTGVPAVSDYKEFLKLVDMLLDSKNKLNRFQNPNIFILVGPSASGKSTVVEMIKEAGYKVIDADQLVHDMQAQGGRLYRALLDWLGEEILLSNGELNRPKLGQLIFSNEEMRQRSAEIQGTIIREELAAQKDYLAKKEDVFFMDIPLLIENGYQDWFDQIWLVAVLPEIQCQRLMKRNHLSVEEAKLRIDSQMSLAEKMPYASLVLDNNGSLDDLKEKVKSAINDLTSSS